MDTDVTFITPEEFAKRLDISRSAVFGWMNSEVLKAGVHYIRIKKTVRFLWGKELIQSLCDASKESAAHPKTPQAKKSEPAISRKRRRVGSTAVNLDF